MKTSLIARMRLARLDASFRSLRGPFGGLVLGMGAHEGDVAANLRDEAVRHGDLARRHVQTADEVAKAKEEEGQFKIDQQRLLGPLIEKLGTVINDVGRENNFSVILRVDAPSLVYKREALDITDLVIKSFNRKG